MAKSSSAHEPPQSLAKAGRGLRDGDGQALRPARKALLRRFGIVAGVDRASVEELSAIPGITPELARSILEHLSG